MTHGIDISKWQGKEFRVEDVDFAILKIGGADDGLYKDSQFDNFYQQTRDNGIPTGCYFYGNAFSIDDAKKEAEFMLELIGDRKFEMPVYYDVEGAMLKQNANTLTEIIITFLECLEDAGFYAGIYGSRDALFKYAVDDTRLAPYTHWVACYGTDEKPVLASGNAVDLWQYTSEYSMQGQNVDANYCYTDFASVITTQGFNNYPNTAMPDPTPVKKTDEQLAEEVIEGLWGNGEDRKKRLTEAGYNYGRIQDLVNNMLETPAYDSFKVGDMVTLGMVGSTLMDVSGVECYIWHPVYKIMGIHDDTAVVGANGQVFSRFYLSQLKRV